MEQEQPSDTVIKECINKYILPYQYEFFTMITKNNYKRISSRYK